MVVACGTPTTFEAGMNPLPFTVRVKAGPPTGTFTGVIEVTMGEGVTIERRTVYESGTPFVATEMAATPSLAITSADMVAVNFVESTNGVTSGVVKNTMVEF